MIDELTTSLARLRFDNRFTRELPADPVEGGRTRPVTRAAYSRVRPLTVPDPRIIAWSPEMSDQLGLGDDVWTSAEAAEVFSGNRLLPGSDPHAANYGGHQFGQWAGQLGDGRAIALGEVIDRDGHHQTLQLKGAGPTPYSRRADGLAVLRSSIREFLCSEAMHHLGVPTTRALSLALTGSQVMRDMLYDGNPRLEPGAVVCRVAPSFIRFGNFQLFAARNEIEELRLLADFTIRHHFAHLLPPGAAAGQAPTPDVYAAWFAEVCHLSAAMVVEWMRVGFVHGVMNTDNMSIHGLTIDYGPYGWLDDYDPDWTPNTTDAAGRRYRFGHQPAVVQWNLLQLANAVYPLVGEAGPLEDALNGFGEDYTGRYRAMLRNKLGLLTDRGDDDDALLHGMLEVLRATETDMTIFHRRLGELPTAELARLGADPDSLGAPDALGDAWYSPHTVTAETRAGIAAWLTAYAVRLVEEARPDAERRAAMERVNPRYVLRNYLAQEAIDAAEQGDTSLIGALAEVLRRPYEDQPGRERFAAKRPDWARSRPGCSMLSCSS